MVRDEELSVARAALSKDTYTVPHSSVAHNDGLVVHSSSAFLPDAAGTTRLPALSGAPWTMLHIEDAIHPAVGVLPVYRIVHFGPPVGKDGAGTGYLDTRAASGTAPIEGVLPPYDLMTVERFGAAIRDPAVPNLEIHCELGLTNYFGYSLLIHLMWRRGSLWRIGAGPGPGTPDVTLEISYDSWLAAHAGVRPWPEAIIADSHLTGTLPAMLTCAGLLSSSHSLTPESAGAIGQAAAITTLRKPEHANEYVGSEADLTALLPTERQLAEWITIRTPRGQQQRLAVPSVGADPGMWYLLDPAHRFEKFCGFVGSHAALHWLPPEPARLAQD